MRKLLLSSIVFAAFQPCFAGTAIGVNSSGQVFQIDDTTGTGSFVNSLGLTGVQNLACRMSDDLLFTEVGGTLYKFALGGSPVVSRTLPFITGTINPMAIDGTGIGWIIDSASKSLYRFGLGSGETFIGNVGISGFISLTFGRDGSLYGLRSISDAGQAGLYVISKVDGHATRVTTGDFDSGDVGPIAEPPGFASVANFLSCFNTGYKISPIFGTKALLGGSTVAIRGLAYQGLTTRIVTNAVTAVNFGAISSNPFGCLEDRDGTPLRICRAFVPNVTVPPIQFVLASTPVAAGTTELALFYKSRMTAAGSFQETVEVLNANTGVFDPQVTLTANLSGHVVNAPITNATNYVPTTRVITSRFKVRPTGFVATQAYCYELDQYVIEYR